MSSPADDPCDVDAWARSGARDLERHAARVHAIVPVAALTRTSEAIQFDVDRGRCRVTLLVTAEALELRLATVEWTGAHACRDSTRLWKRVLWEGLDDGSLRELIDDAFERRLSEFVRCRFCRRSTPPEHRHDDVCHGCAERHLGIVH
jgi:hypothetical protein